MPASTVNVIPLVTASTRPSVAESSSSSPVWAAWIGTAHWKMASQASMSSGIAERTRRSPVRCWWALISPGITRWPGPPSRSASGAVRRQLGGRSDGDDAVAVDEHAAVGDHPAVGIHREDDVPQHEQHGRMV